MAILSPSWLTTSLRIDIAAFNESTHRPLFGSSSIVAPLKNESCTAISCDPSGVKTTDVTLWDSPLGASVPGGGG